MREREDVDELGGNGGGGIGERDGRLPNSLVMEVDDNQVLVDQSIISRFEGERYDNKVPVDCRLSVDSKVGIRIRAVQELVIY